MFVLWLGICSGIKPVSIWFIDVLDDVRNILGNLLKKLIALVEGAFLEAILDLEGRKESFVCLLLILVGCKEERLEEHNLCFPCLLPTTKGTKWFGWNIVSAKIGLLRQNNKQIGSDDILWVLRCISWLKRITYLRGLKPGYIY